MRHRHDYVALASEAIAIGGLIYLLDPDKYGRRRRVLVRDKAVRAEHIATRFADKTVRDMRNRIRGIVAESWARVRERHVPDEKLAQRVRTRLGRVVSHPHAITVEAHDGVVILRGPILEHEVRRLLRTVRSVRGVQAVENRLEPHKTADGVPDLQGRSKRPGADLDVLQESWSPTTRTLVGLGALGLLKLGRRRPMSFPLAVTGAAALLLRAITNMPLKRALGFEPTARVIRFEKTINIHAPVEEIYQLFSDPENFPKIFEHVKEVRHTRDNLYHWTVAGPAGVSVGWEAALTEKIPNRVIAWSSVPDAALRTEGSVKFQPNPDGSTAVHIQFTYNPPGGVLGHVIAWLIGADPKHELDDDMSRLKSLFENGKTTVHHHRITKEELEREISCKERTSI